MSLEVYMDPESVMVEGNYYPLPTGIIYVEDDEGAFPDYDYNDFVSVLLDWWTKELVNFAWGAKAVKLRFVDEHYYIHLVHEDNNVCKAYLGQTTLSGNEVTRECEFDLDDLIKSLSRAVNALLRNEEFTKSKPKEAEELRYALDRLRSHKK